MLKLKQLIKNSYKIILWIAKWKKVRISTNKKSDLYI